MNPVSSEAGWFFQQDYITFLAVLGWLTVALVAWGNAAADARARVIPWRWFAFFAFFASVDATLDLTKLIVPRIWPAEIDPIFRLAGYGCLLEFSRRSIRRLRWYRIGPVVPAVIPVVALAVVFYFPNTSPVPEVLVALVSSVSAAVAISAFVGKGNRSLLATAAALLLLSGGETLRGQGGVVIEGLYGLPVTGPGFETAIFSAVLAWVAGGGLWVNGVLRRRAGVYSSRGGARSPLVSLALPGVIAMTLVVGYYLVDVSSEQVKKRIESDYLLNARTAVLAIDTDALATALQENREAPPSLASQKIARQVAALQLVSSKLARVYVWKMRSGLPDIRPTWLASRPGALPRLESPAVKKLGPKSLTSDDSARLIGPLGGRESAVMLANAPILDADRKQTLAWLGIEIPAREWFASQASARLQTIALVGLFASVVVFFVALQMLREYEGELVVAKESAEAADRAKDEFLAVMSHEMRTPMQSVLGYSELLVRTKLDETQTGYLDTIRSQGRTLLRIVQDILDFAILRKSNYTLKSEDVYLHRLVRSAFETVRPLAARKEIGIELFITDDVPEVVRGDGVRIEQILLNLLGNAVKFTDNGRIQLDVSLSVEENRHGENVRIVVFSVSDTGMGIRRSDQRKLFEPFTRLSYAENTRREGAGLGLAIVRRICELMGGDIQLVSEWGRGTRFFVRLPLEVVSAKLPTETSEKHRSVAVPAEEIINLAEIVPLRIAVADDNPFIRRLMVEYLRSIGYDPEALGDGLEALAQWRNFDVIMMDLRMPGLDGVTAARRIRAESGSDAEPWIIGVSATLSETEISRAMDAGMNDFLGKPFFAQSLIEAIKASPHYGLHAHEAVSKASTASRVADESEPAEDANGDKSSASEIPEPVHASGGMDWMPDLSESGGELVEEAIAEIPVVIGEISDALNREDLETAADRAHYLKNTIFALRIDPLVTSCRSLNERARDGQLSGARESLEALRAAFVSWVAAREQKRL